MDGTGGSKRTPGAGRRLVLASASPQRRDILHRLGVEFDIVVPDVEEISGGDPATDILENARRKADAVWQRLVSDSAWPVVIACDTDVVYEGRILGKPANESEAEDYLRNLSGRTHEVISAIVVLGLPSAGKSVDERRSGSSQRQRREGIERSRVRFRELSEAGIEWYVGTGEWRGRAGGYAIQGFGTALVAGVEGDISNVIGLPVPVLVDIASEIFR